MKKETAKVKALTDTLPNIFRKNIPVLSGGKKNPKPQTPECNQIPVIFISYDSNAALKKHTL